MVEDVIGYAGVIRNPITGWNYAIGRSRYGFIERAALLYDGDDPWEVLKSADDLWRNGTIRCAEALCNDLMDHAFAHLWDGDEWLVNLSFNDAEEEFHAVR